MNTNKFATAHHDGTKDPNCNYHNNHLHLMVAITTNEKHIQHSYSYRQLQRNIQPAKIYSQKNKQPPNFTGYLLKPLKTYIGTNTEHIRLLMLENQANTTSQTTNSLALLKQTKPHQQKISQKCIWIYRHYSKL